MHTLAGAGWQTLETMPPADAYRLGDGAPVTLDSARAIWAVVAREVLEETARRYNNVVTAADLAKQVQDRSGVHTRTPASAWLPSVLADVTTACAAAGDPDLATLCRRDEVGDDLHRAEQRLAAYRQLSRDLPADGGRPSLLQRPSPPRVSRPRASTPKPTARKRQTPLAICPTCFMALPASGRCDTCG